MIFLGQVLQISKRDSHHKIVAGVECGYHVDNYTIRANDDKMIDDLQVGDKILFTGRFSSRDGIEQFYLESLMRRDFESCSICGLPLTSDTCLLSHNEEAQRLDGQWKVVHKVDSRGCIKLFFEKGHYVFAAVASPRMWIHTKFQELLENDFVTLDGWRYRQNTTLKFISKFRI